jgi:hypothetical protein
MINELVAATTGGRFGAADTLAKPGQGEAPWGDGVQIMSLAAPRVAVSLGAKQGGSLEGPGPTGEMRAQWAWDTMGAGAGVRLGLAGGKACAASLIASRPSCGAQLPPLS